jgi:membrane protein YqaA with SNARE-associated domain
MEAWIPIGSWYLPFSCFALSIVSALVPWVNGEILLLSFAALGRSSLQAAIMVVLASLGQMVGKCVLYWTAQSLVASQSKHMSPRMAGLMKRFKKSSSRPMALVFLSSTVGIPPFYMVTIVAGALRINFNRFVGVGMCGRLVRFGLLVSIPELTLGYFWT